METKMKNCKYLSGQVHRIVLSFFVFLFISDGIAWAGVDMVIDSIRYQLDNDGTASVIKHKPYLYYGYKYDGHLVIPNSVEYGGKVYIVDEIAANTFYYCRELLSVTIPSSIKTIGKNAFEGCDKMDYVNIEDIVSWCGIEFKGLYANPLSIAHRLYIQGQEVKDLVLPVDLTSVSPYAFYNCLNLNTVKFPDSMTTIGDSAFYNCNNLESVSIPSSITRIGVEAFAYIGSRCAIHITDLASWCNIKFETPLANPLYGHCLYINGQEVKALDIPEGLTRIGDYVFSGFHDLVSLTLPTSITEMGNGAFVNCSGLTSLTLPNNLVSIGDATFRGCNSLKTVTIPQSVKSIGKESFFLCSNLISMNILSPDVKIGAYAFRDCMTLENVSLPEGLEELPMGCFSGCRSLQHITLPQSIKQMGASCFIDCRALLSIRLPQNLKQISGGCFNGCSQLRRVVILSDDYCVLEEGCFFNCSLLNDFIIHATTPPERKEGKYYIYSDNWVMKDDQFYTPYGGGKKNLYVPVGSIENYRNSDLWGQWKNIMPLEEYLDDDEMQEDIHPSSDGKYTYRGLYYTLDEEKGVASVVGVIDSYYYSPSPAIYDGRLEVTNVLIPERVSYKGKVYPVTNIGDRCFYEYRNLCSITIPSTIKTLGVRCFEETWSLFSVTLPEGLESIGEGCFYDSGLKKVDIPSSVTYIGDCCFEDAALESVILRSDRLDFLGAGSFKAYKLSQFVCYAEDVPQFEHEMWGWTYTPFLNDMISQKGTLYVQKELVDAYRASEDWGRWKEILPIDAYDSTNDITTVEGEKEADAIIYDLQGRKVATPQKNRLYIKNGKKFVGN